MGYKPPFIGALFAESRILSNDTSNPVTLRNLSTSALSFACAADALKEAIITAVNINNDINFKTRIWFSSDNIGL